MARQTTCHRVSAVVALAMIAGMGTCAAAESNIATLVRGNTTFAFAAYDRLVKPEENLLFSPYSISCALAMTYAGARGETAKQMASALSFPLSQEDLHPAFSGIEAGLNRMREGDKVTLLAANAIWPQPTMELLTEYLSILKTHYRVTVTPVDYGKPEVARRTINSWVEERTRDKIKDLLPAGVITPRVRLILTEAIYFKGAWESPFTQSRTFDAPFLVSPGRTVTVRMMKQKRDFPFADFGHMQAIEMPYVNGEISMLVLLPREADGLRVLESTLSAGNLEKWSRDLRETKVDLSLPKFTMTTSFDLNQVLQGMGMVDALTERADFSGIDGTRSLNIAAVLHKAFVDVGEEGAEAAAASAVAMVASAGPPKETPIFRADHPFIFMIRDRQTGTILFLGRVKDPTKQN